MGGINQSLFLIGALFIGQGAIPGQGSAAVVLLAVGLLLSWAATPGWTELILMYPNRVGGIAATCAEAFRPYSPVLANLTGVCYWWGWVPTCGLTATLASTALVHWCLPAMPDYAPRVLASGIVILFAAVNLCGVKWVMRLAMPVATAAAALAFCSAILPITSGSVDWQQAFSFHLTVPFPGWFGQVTSVMAGLYLIGFAAPAFEQEAVELLTTRPTWKASVRLVEVPAGDPWEATGGLELRSIAGAVLAQRPDVACDDPATWRVVTRVAPAPALTQALDFAFTIVRRLTSNAIAVCQGTSLVGAGIGQTSRVDAVRIALEKAGNRMGGAVLASDAFFPFPDSIDLIARAGIAAVIQPGGSKRDAEVIAAADAAGIPMVFTSRRHFRH